MRKLFAVCLLALGTMSPVLAQVTVQIGIPDVRIDLGVPVYPQLVRVPNYPVYYAPQVRANYFFYDGLYWVYRNGNWYASYWYNGPWGLVEPYAVPAYVLRIPVRYYNDQPQRFSSTWRVDAPPRWVEVWGPEWEQRRSGWDRWNRNAVPAPAPLPVYQRQYTGSRYPQVTEQPVLQSRYYSFQPRDPVVRQYYQHQGVQVGSGTTRQQAQRNESNAAKASKPEKEHKYKEPKPAKEPKAPKEPKYKEPKPEKEPKAHHEAKAPKEHKHDKEPKAEKEHKHGKEPKAEKEHKEKGGKEGK